jgi:hypothetical protein
MIMGIIKNQISRIHELSSKRAFILFVILDIVCIGMGMGVPFFNIVFGFPVGWFLVKRLSLNTRDMKANLQRLLVGSCITASVTLAGMLLIWGWSISILLESDAKIANFGLPLILYSPRASLIGWLILMIVISPVLQLLTTVFAGNLTLLSIYGKEKP